MRPTNVPVDKSWGTATTSSPIKIVQVAKEKPSRTIAHSAPASAYVPKAPSSRPKVPQQDPPPMMLPPSPPVFFPVNQSSSTSQNHAIPTPAQPISRSALSTWSSLYSSSCPNPQFLAEAMLTTTSEEFHLQELGENNLDDTDVLPPRVSRSRLSFDDASATVLGQSPTIFSLLQRPSQVGLPFSGGEKTLIPSSRAVTLSPPNIFTLEGEDNGEDEGRNSQCDDSRPSQCDSRNDSFYNLMFPVSMDPDPDNALAQAARDYLSFPMH